MHAAQSIREWFVTTCTGVVGLPNATSGIPRQAKAGVDACYIIPGLEQVEGVTVSLNDVIDKRTLQIDVVLVASSFTEVDGFSVLAEEKIATATAFPGKGITLAQRQYEQIVEGDRSYVSLILTYEAEYYVEDTDVETFR